MSRALTVPAALAGIVLVSASAFAAAQTKVGEIKSIDVAKKEIVLSSGETFETQKSVKLSSLKTGEKISVVFESKDGKMLASHVSPAK